MFLIYGEFCLLVYSTLLNTVIIRSFDAGHLVNLRTGLECMATHFCGKIKEAWHKNTCTVH